MKTMNEYQDTEYRRMVCPFCGYELLTDGIGAMYCGPHDLGNGRYEPAVRMREAEHIDERILTCI